jgi:hypothetical protein
VICERVEMRWHLDEYAMWQVRPFFMVCGHHHRVRVEPLD